MTRKLLSIDPGPTQSAWMLYGTGPISFGKVDNRALLEKCDDHIGGFDHLAIEMVQYYGSDMHAGAETFQTCVWIGRFVQACAARGVGYSFLYRPKIKAHLCGLANAKDKNVRQALIDRFGGNTTAIGKKANPGPLHGVSNDAWSALAIAVTFADLHPRFHEITAAATVAESPLFQSA